MNKSQETEYGSSNDTLIVEEDDLDRMLKKYTSNNTLRQKHSPEKAIYNLNDFSETANKLHTSNNAQGQKHKPKKNIYDLDDFSDIEEDHQPPVQERPQKNSDQHSWQHKFSALDFAEDSTEWDELFNHYDPGGSKQSGHDISRELKTLLDSDTVLPQLGSSNGERVPRSSYKAEQCQMDKPDSNPPAKRQKKQAEKSDKDIDKEIAKAAKARERELKKLEKEQQKQLKNALRVVESSSKPDQCIQFLTVNIDETLYSKPHAEVIIALLKSKGFNYKVLKQTVPNLISFTRNVPTVKNMGLQTINQEEKPCLLIIDISEFIQLVSDDTLVEHVQSILSIPQVGHLSLGILGLQGYYKHFKTELNREFKAAVANSTNIFKNLPKVSRKDIEMKLIQLQVFCTHIYVRPLENLEDVAVFVGECAKSVAQIPFKTAKAESLQLENEFFAVNNRDCVKIDKDGNGLNRLWNQILRMFPLASLETAEAITSIYPTMHSLMEAYKNCNTTEGEKLLQDIPVRRAAGPLGGQRKLGPELSKKIYRFFNSEENVLL